jgi:hypothetical protein
MYFYVGLVGILRPLHSPSYLGSQDWLFVISAFCHIGFLAYWLFGISAFWHIGFLYIGFFAYWLITYRVFAASAYCTSAFYEGSLDRLFVISAFCISAFLHIGFLHIGFLFMISSFLSYRLFVISAFCFIGFLISAF